MPYPTDQTIRQLAQVEDTPCVSIYMPTQKKVATPKVDPVRFRNLIKEARSAAHEASWDRNGLYNALDHAGSLAYDLDFWRHQEHGLGVLFSSDTFYTLSLDWPPAAHQVVSDRFCIKPLMCPAARQRAFYVLAIAGSNTRLLDCTDGQALVVDVPNMPGSMDEVLKYDDPERSVQFHTGTPSGSGDRQAMVFGHGEKKDARLGARIRYVQAVEHAVTRHLGASRLPLILAAGDKYRGLYLEANTFPHLSVETINTNPQNEPDRELAEKGQAIMEERHRQELGAAVENFRRHASTDQASTDVRSVAQAAVEGRVAALIADRAAHVWGRISTDDLSATIHDEKQPFDVDLADLAVSKALYNGADVFVVPAEEMPVAAPVAAVYRY